MLFKLSLELIPGSFDLKLVHGELDICEVTIVRPTSRYRSVLPCEWKTVNDCDWDVCLALWLVRNPTRIAGTRSEPLSAIFLPPVASICCSSRRSSIKLRATTSGVEATTAADPLVNAEALFLRRNCSK